MLTRRWVTRSAVSWTTAIALTAILAGCGSGEPGPIVTGEVTLAQYRGAVERARDCVAREGFEVSEINDGNAGGLLLTFSFESGADPNDPNGPSAAFDSCYAEHVEEIERAWFWGNVPTGAQRDAMYAEFLVCLADAGIDVTPLTPSSTKEQVTGVILGAPEDDAVSSGLWCLDEFLVLYPDGMFPE